MSHCQLKKKLDNLGRTQKSDSEMDSPKSNQSEEFAISSCTSSCSATTCTAKGNAQQYNSARSVSSDCGMTMSDSVSSTDDMDPSRNEIAKLKRSKRKKGKEKATEENTALDPIRYKTKMCKNWQQHEKCPYGPRCLFAHGTKEMRTYTVNHNAISSACNSASPERQFYALGHFPNFMPVPFGAAGEEATPVSDTQPSEESRETPPPAKEPPVQYTHSPYTPLSMTTQEPISPPAPQFPVAECGNPGVIPDPYYFPHRAFHAHIPMFPQPPFVPPECTLYAGPYSHHMQQYHHMAPAEMYPMPFYQSVR